MCTYNLEACSSTDRWSKKLFSHLGVALEPPAHTGTAHSGETASLARFSFFLFSFPKHSEEVCDYSVAPSLQQTRAPKAAGVSCFHTFLHANSYLFCFFSLGGLWALPGPSSPAAATLGSCFETHLDFYCSTQPYPSLA